MIIMRGISTRTLALSLPAAMLAAGGALTATTGASGSTQQHCRVTVTYTVVSGQVFTGWQQHHCPGITNGRVRQLERLGGNPSGFSLSYLRPGEFGTWRVAVSGDQPGVPHVRNGSSCVITGARQAFAS